MRERCGLFDVSHMGEIELRGRGRRGAVSAPDGQRRRAARASAAGSTRSSATSGGGVIDDVIVYRLGADRFLLVVNAANTDRRPRVDRASTRAPAPRSSTAATRPALLALQGPERGARALADADAGVDLASLRPFTVRRRRRSRASGPGLAHGLHRRGRLRALRRPADAARAVWDALLDAVRRRGGMPAGLGARDTLRLEAALPLYGTDIDDDDDAARGRARLGGEAGEAATSSGVSALARAARAGRAAAARRPRAGRAGRARGTAIRSGTGTCVSGSVTSGTKSPTLGHLHRARRTSTQRLRAPGHGPRRRDPRAARCRRVSSTRPFYRRAGIRSRSDATCRSDLRYTKEHEWVRLEGDGGRRRHHRLRAGPARATSSSSSCRRSARR